MKKKANRIDNPLASSSGLEERENDISINAVSDRDLKTSGIDFDDFISHLDALVEHRMGSNCQIFYQFIVPYADKGQIKIREDEDLYESKDAQRQD